MFTLNKTHFVQGKSLALVIAFEDKYCKEIVSHGCSYIFDPLGEVNATTFAFRVTRTVSTFTDTYPSYLKTRETYTQIWERADVSLSVSSSLTAHLYAIVSALDTEFVNRSETLSETDWFGVQYVPSMRAHFYLGDKVVRA